MEATTAADSPASARAAVGSPGKISRGGWRLLHVESDGVDAMKLRLALRNELPAGSTIDYASHWEEALRLLADASYDAVLVGCSVYESWDEARVQRLIVRAGGAPTAILSGDDRHGAALAAGRLGAGEYLLKSKLTSQSAADLLHRLIRQEPADATGVAASEQRQATRYSVVAPAVVIPLHADGRPGRDIPASAVELSEVGVSVLAEVDDDAVPEVCVVGLEGGDGVYRFATVQWRQRRLAVPAMYFGGRFLAASEDPFAAARLHPRCDPARFRFRPSFDETLLAEWTARGVLQPRVVDRVKACPACRALPTYRDGCPDCGSADVAPQQLLHHFACAHVAPTGEFAAPQGGAATGLTCPKCRTPRLVVGADFEHLPGPIGCSECSWTGAAAQLIAECLGCGQRFPGEEAIEIDVVAYHVQRLDPVAFLANAP